MMVTETARDLQHAIADMQNHLGVCNQCGNNVLCCEGEILMLQLLVLRRAFTDALKQLCWWLGGAAVSAAAAAHFFL